MLSKVCAPPASAGSSSGGLTNYLVGYAVAGKGATRDQIAAAIDAVELEAEAREDRGVGRIWSPEAGHGTRPSSILVRNCESYATASMEIDAAGASNGSVDHAAMHLVHSWSTAESANLTDKQVHAYVGELLDKVGIGHHKSVAVVHRDTIVRDPLTGTVIDGNVHVHVAVATVNHTTGMNYTQKGLWGRLSRADREIELAHRLQHDRGLYVVRNPNTTEAHVEEATREELVAWRRERQEERLVAMERRNAEGYKKRDATFDRYADATVAPRLRTAMELARQDAREPDWATLHAVSARYGCELQCDDEGRVIFRDVGVGELRLAHQKIERTRERELKESGAENDEIAQTMATLRSAHEKAQVAERDRKRSEGEAVVLDSVLDADRSDMPAFQTVDEAEHAFETAVEADPSIILREITSSQSTFSRDDIDRALGRRIGDPLALERLGDLVVGHQSVRALEADTRYPLLTTIEILDIEKILHADATELSQRGSGFTSDEIERAMSVYEAKQSTEEQPFRLSEEQRGALRLMERGHLVCIEGLPGVGKTTIMSAVRELAEAQGMQIVGLTLSQAAAERLESEAGFKCVNTARARIMEEKNEKVIPYRSIVVVDEAGMVDSRAMARIVAKAKERESVVVTIADLRQLQAIDAGASFRILSDIAKAAGSYSELRDVQRQKRDWHKDAVVLMSDAIIEKDDARRLDLVTRSFNILEEHKAITWAATRDDAIDHAVKSARAYRAAGLQDTLLLAGDKDTTRHLAEEYRRRDGLEGAGRAYMTAGGRRELAEGDRFVFLENSLTGKRALGVRNGDTGHVVEVKPNQISVRLDREDRVVTFSPRSYQNWDQAGALTVHKSQGASVDGVVPLLDRSASAELAFVAMSRSKHALDVVVPRTAFADVDELARHISERISLKTTTRTYEEELARTGGPENLWAKKMERAEEQRTNPLRMQWQSEIVEPMLAARRERLRESSEALRVAREDARGEGGGLAERLARDRELLREAKVRNASIIAETTASKFRTWAKEEASQQEQTRERGRTKQQQRDTAARRDRSALATIREREVESDHGYER